MDNPSSTLFKANSKTMEKHPIPKACLSNVIPTFKQLFYHTAAQSTLYWNV